MSLLLLFHGGGGAPPVVQPPNDGARWPVGRRRLPSDIAREQRMVEEYLQALEKRQRLAKRIERMPARAQRAAVAKAPVIPVLTEAMARVASEMQLQRIAEHALAVERARAIALAETRRRRLLAVMLLAIDD